MLGKLNATDRSSRALIGLGLAVILFFAVNIFSNTAFKSMQLDLTDDKLFTLSEGTKRVLASLDEPVDIRLYSQLFQTLALFILFLLFTRFKIQYL